MELSPLYTISFAVGTTLSLLVVLRIGQRLCSPQKTVAKGFAEDNAAQHLLHVGQVLGVFLVSASIVKNCVEGQHLAHDIASVAGFGILSVALAALMGELGTRLLLRARLPAELDRGNVAAGLAAGSHFVATGIIAANAIAGTRLRDVGISLLFFVIAIATLWVFVSLFRVLTTYDDSEQIHGENLAAALSYAGLTIAVAIIVGRALEGDFVSWGASLKSYGAILVLAFALYPVRQLFVQSILLGAPLSIRGGRLDTGVGIERNGGLGALEATTYVATALAVAQLV
ncbi:MAG: DUF350 domain-containing protein [Polyangiaceae bacterium]|nr:DUF350 domain-containing protein [Polyangiaceae bacterium]